MDGYAIAEIVEEVQTKPTTDENYEIRKAAGFELGRSMSWAGVKEVDWGAVTKRAGETDALFQAGRKEEACRLFDRNLKDLGRVARDLGLFAERPTS